MPTRYRALEGPLRWRLADRDVLIKDLAAQVGVSTRTLSRAINGEPMVWSFVSRLALALDVAPDAICKPIPNDDDDAEAVAG